MNRFKKFIYFIVFAITVLSTIVLGIQLSSQDKIKSSSKAEGREVSQSANNSFLDLTTNYQCCVKIDTWSTLDPNIKYQQDYVYYGAGKTPTSPDPKHDCVIVNGSVCDINHDGQYQAIDEQGNSVIATYDDPSLSCLVCYNPQAGNVITYLHSGPYSEQSGSCPNPSQYGKRTYASNGYQWDEQVSCPPTLTPTPTLSPISESCKSCDFNDDQKYNDLDKSLIVNCLPESSHCPIADLTGDGVVDNNDIDLAHLCQSNFHASPNCQKINFNGYGSITNEEVDVLNNCLTISKNICSLKDPNKDDWLNMSDASFCDQNCRIVTPTVTPSPTSALPIALDVRMLTKNPTAYMNKRVKVMGRLVALPQDCSADKSKCSYNQTKCCLGGAELYLTNPKSITDELDNLILVQFDYQSRGNLFCPRRPDGSLNCGIYKPGDTYVFEGTLGQTSTYIDYVDSGGVKTGYKKLMVLQTSYGLCYPSDRIVSGLVDGRDFIRCFKGVVNKPTISPTPISSSPSPIPPISPTSSLTIDKCVRCDLNSDKRINLVDIRLFLGAYRIRSMTVDFDQNGVVNMFDFAHMLRCFQQYYRKTLTP